MSLLRRIKPNIFIKPNQLHTVRSKSPIEASFQVPWGRIAGKWWGPQDIKPIICLHGLQDNCGTFNKLIPLILKNNDLSFLAIDLPGHGYSTSFPRGLLYNFMNYIILLECLSLHFDWNKLSFLSHSLGSMISFIYAIIYPEKVNFLVCLDALQPSVGKVSADVMRKNVDRFMLYDRYKAKDEEPRAYTWDELTEKMITSYRNAIKKESVHILLERNVAPSKKYPGKYYFIRDPKLKVRSMFNWPQNQILEDVPNVTHPIFVCETKPINGPERKNFHEVVRTLHDVNKQLDFHVIEGNHHLHLDEPEKIANHIDRFLSKYYIAESNDMSESSIQFHEPQLIYTHSG